MVDTYRALRCCLNKPEGTCNRKPAGIVVLDSQLSSFCLVENQPCEMMILVGEHNHNIANRVVDC